MADLRSILVANRGEIALRIMRTARSLGIRTIAVYADADSQAPHVLFADEAVRIGPSPVSESYLRGDRIIAAAKTAGAEAIHPGYGFLSENAEFATAVDEAGLIFIGPTAEAIDLMGDKAVAKRRMIAAGVPCVPGYEGEDQSEACFIECAEQIGYPVMVKAAAGGGGRGMRLVARPEGLVSALKTARAEAANAFGNGDLILEKAIVRPRHVEVQVFADTLGNVVHLGERDCSVQRRHQKVIEEAPCPVMTEELRVDMGAAAVEAARAVDYRGAGTVEFLLDASGEFYFLEMNTRLQVEHPVTECITGLDLVALQIKVANGHPLGFSQEDVRLQGHAIEVRFYAEDPAQDFLPSTGRILRWQPPAGEGVRVDAGIESGSEVSPYYDAMVAKIIAWGRDREEARRRLVRALGSTVLIGTHTNRDFLIDALQRDAFVDGEATTAFIEDTYGEAGYTPAQPGVRLLAAAAVIQHRIGQRQSLARSVSVSPELLDWSSAGDLESVRQYLVGDKLHALTVRPGSEGSYDVSMDEERARSVEVVRLDEGSGKLLIDRIAMECHFHAVSDRVLHLVTESCTLTFTDLSGGSADDSESAGGGTVTAPMHGMLVEIFVGEGDRVEKGDRLAILEAMKMQHEILAEIDGTVISIVASAGNQIAADDLILEIEAEEEAASAVAGK